MQRQLALRARANQLWDHIADLRRSAARLEGLRRDLVAEADRLGERRARLLAAAGIDPSTWDDDMVLDRGSF